MARTKGRSNDCDTGINREEQEQKYIRFVHKEMRPGPGANADVTILCQRTVRSHWISANIRLIKLSRSAYFYVKKKTPGEYTGD